MVNRWVMGLIVVYTFVGGGHLRAESHSPQDERKKNLVVIEYETPVKAASTDTSAVMIGSAIGLAVPVTVGASYMYATSIVPEFGMISGGFIGGIIGVHAILPSLLIEWEQTQVSQWPYRYQLLFHTALPLATGLCLYTLASLNMP